MATRVMSASLTGEPGAPRALQPPCYVIERLHLDDIPEVQVIERASFSSPWSAQAYEQDLSTNKLAHYIVLRQTNLAPAESRRAMSPPPATETPSSFMTRGVQRLLRGLRTPAQAPREPRPPIVGFAGTWMMVDEAHLVTIAVAPEHRGKGLGELLLIAMIDLACILGAGRMTLEVRVSNHVAQSLYLKYGFKNEGVRRRYYSDNGEDAMIMTTDVLTSPYYQAHYQELKRALLSKISVSFNHLP